MLGLQIVTTARIPAGFVALVLALTAASYPASGTTPLLAASPAPQRSLALNLASSQELSAMSTGALVAEVNAIWWHSNLSLIWRTADVSDPLPAMPESEDWLRVLVLARQRPSAGETSTFAVGELVRHEGARPLAIASLTAARRVVEESGRFQIARRSARLRPPARRGARPRRRARNRALPPRQYACRSRADARQHRRAGIRRRSQPLLPARRCLAGAAGEARVCRANSGAHPYLLHALARRHHSSRRRYTRSSRWRCGSC